MRNKYYDLIDQTFVFPQDPFRVEDNCLMFHDIPLMDIIGQYGTPLKLTYLPKIGEQIRKAKQWFNVARAKARYKGKYSFAYCTKSCHFSFVLEEVLKHEAHIETSSAFDINIVNSLAAQGLLQKDIYIICNGYKKAQYITNIAGLVKDGFENLVVVLDRAQELDELTRVIKRPVKIGIRIASEEEPKFEFYTSRLGIGYKDILPFYQDKVARTPKVELKMLHFFINTGITDTAYYWNELQKSVNVYCELKKECSSLDTLNIGGGFPIKNSLGFQYDYEYMAEEIIAQVKSLCDSRGVPEPHIFSEFGSFTVGESGALLLQIIGQKKQNDRELWDFIDSSFMTTLPDSWALKKRFILLAINNWDAEYERVNLGGLTCDSDDFYNTEIHKNAIFLPKLREGEPQYIGFFHTGAYQESIGGYGGLQHCLLPAPKHVVIDRENGKYTTKLFAKEQGYKPMLKILGYL
jgi:arginine decarboxylase